MDDDFIKGDDHDDGTGAFVATAGQAGLEEEDDDVCEEEEVKGATPPPRHHRSHRAKREKREAEAAIMAEADELLFSEEYRAMIRLMRAQEVSSKLSDRKHSNV